MNEYMGDNGVFDSSTNSSHRREFFHGFISAFTGTLIGAALDNTRFGRWFNTSPTIGWIYHKLRQVFTIGVIIFVVIYIYELIKIW
jgi:hypothetical protein